MRVKNNWPPNTARTHATISTPAHFSQSHILIRRGPQHNPLSPLCLCCPNCPPACRPRLIHFFIQSMLCSDSMFNQSPRAGAFPRREQVAFRAEFRKSLPMITLAALTALFFTVALICHPHKLTRAQRSDQHPAKAVPRGP